MVCCTLPKFLSLALLESVLAQPMKLRIIFMNHGEAPPIGEQTSGSSDPLDDIFKLLAPPMPDQTAPNDGISKNILDSIPSLDPSGTIYPLLSHLAHNSDCEDDAKRYCASKIGSSMATSEYWKCMSEHKSSLSAVCLASIKNHVPFICQAMINQYCDDETEKLDCLSKKDDLLEPDCRFALATTKKTIKKVNAAPKWGLVNNEGTLLHVFENHAASAGWPLLQFVFVLLVLYFMWRTVRNETREAVLQMMSNAKPKKSWPHDMNEMEEDVHLYGAI